MLPIRALPLQPTSIAPSDGGDRSRPRAASLLALLLLLTTTPLLPTQLWASTVAKPSDEWIIPRFVLDSRLLSDVTTFWAIHNPSIHPMQVTLDYFDQKPTASGQAKLLATETIALDGNQTITRDLRSMPELQLPALGGVYAEGWIELSGKQSGSNDPAEFLVDSFRVDSVNDYATGDLATTGEGCREWRVRTLQFGSGPSRIEVFTPQPKGVGDNTIWTALVSPFFESGTHQSSYNQVIEDPNFVFDFSATDFGDGMVDIGVYEITLYSPGFVRVSHSARERFSVSHGAVCMD